MIKKSRMCKRYICEKTNCGDEEERHCRPAITMYASDYRKLMEVVRCASNVTHFFESEKCMPNELLWWHGELSEALKRLERKA